MPAPHCDLRRDHFGTFREPTPLPSETGNSVRNSRPNGLNRSTRSFSRRAGLAHERLDQAPSYPQLEPRDRREDDRLRDNGAYNQPSKRIRTDDGPHELFPRPSYALSEDQEWNSAPERRDQDLSPSSAGTESGSASLGSSSSEGTKQAARPHFDPYLLQAYTWNALVQKVKNLAERITRMELTTSGEGASSLNKVCYIFMSRKIKREEIHERKLWTTSWSNLRTLAENFAVMGASVNGTLFAKKFGGADGWEHFKKWDEIVQPGVVFSGPIEQQLCEDNIEPGDIDRMSNPVARALAEIRICLILRVDGEEAQVLYGTSFDGSEELPARVKGQCFQLVTSGEGMPSERKGASAIPFDREEPLPKTTWMRYTRKHWVNLKKMPLKKEGKLAVSSLRRIAVLMSLRDGHPFWSDGKPTTETKNNQRSQPKQAAQEHPESDVSFQDGEGLEDGEIQEGRD